MRTRNVIFSLALTLCLFLPLSTASAAEYTITKTQLQALESRLSKLRTNNETLADGLSKLKAQLATSQAALKEAQEQSAQLKTQLAALKLQSKSSEYLLESANKSLQEYATEEKRTRLRIKRQRNLAYVLLGGVVIYAMNKAM